MATKMAPEIERLLEEPITELGIPVRTVNALERFDVLTTEQLLQCCPHRRADCRVNCTCPAVANDPGWEPWCYLLDIPNFGEKTLEDIRARLRSHGFG